MATKFAVMPSVTASQLRLKFIANPIIYIIEYLFSDLGLGYLFNDLLIVFLSGIQLGPYPHLPHFVKQPDIILNMYRIGTSHSHASKVQN